MSKERVPLEEWTVESFRRLAAACSARHEITIKRYEGADATKYDFPGKVPTGDTGCSILAYGWTLEKRSCRCF